MASSSDDYISPASNRDGGPNSQLECRTASAMHSFLSGTNVAENHSRKRECNPSALHPGVHLGPHSKIRLTVRKAIRLNPPSPTRRVIQLNTLPLPIQKDIALHGNHVNPSLDTPSTSLDPDPQDQPVTLFSKLPSDRFLSGLQVTRASIQTIDPTWSVRVAKGCVTHDIRRFAVEWMLGNMNSGKLSIDVHIVSVGIQIFDIIMSRQTNVSYEEYVGQNVSRLALLVAACFWIATKSDGMCIIADEIAKLVHISNRPTVDQLNEMELIAFKQLRCMVPQDSVFRQLSCILSPVHRDRIAIRTFQEWTQCDLLTSICLLTELSLLCPEHSALHPRTHAILVISIAAPQLIKRSIMIKESEYVSSTAMCDFVVPILEFLTRNQPRFTNFGANDFQRVLDACKRCHETKAP